MGLGRSLRNGIVTLLKGIETGDPLSVEVFRFENDMAVEHWDNIQLRRGQNNSNYSMVNGPTEVKDLDKTEGNRNIVITVSLVSWFVFFGPVQDSGGTATLVPPYLQTSADVGVFIIQVRTRGVVCLFRLFKRKVKL